MLHSEFNFNGQYPSSHTIIADEVALSRIQHFAPELAINAIAISSIKKSREQIINAESLSLRASKSDSETLASLLGSLRRVQFMSVPSSLIDILDARVPEGLETLEIVGVENAKLPAAFQNMGLKRILSWPAVTSFSMEQIPSVSHFFTRLDPKGKLLYEIAKFPKIDVFTISDQKGIERIPSRDWSDVRFLRVIKNTINSLSEIGRFVGVTNLLIQDCSKITDLGGIQKLERLKELTIGYCPKLETLDGLGKMRLRGLHIFGCRRLRRLKAEESVASLNIEDLVLNL